MGIVLTDVELPPTEENSLVSTLSEKESPLLFLINSLHMFLKAIPLQSWTDPEVSRRRRLQISRQSAHEGGKVSSRHRPHLPPT